MVSGGGVIKNKTVYYHEFTDDVVVTAHQDYRLPTNYRYTHSRFYDGASDLLQRVVQVVTWPLCRFGLHTRIRNRAVLKPFLHQAVYLYGNHTSPLGDVFVPFQLTHRLATIVAPVNLKLPVIGRLLPLGGVVPVPDSLNQYRAFLQAIATKISHRKAVVVYPEAHVWPYATMIRPFDDAAFRYPVTQPAPVFCMTTTYQKSKWHRKPNATLYVDGPFYPDTTLSPKAQQRALRDTIYDCMTRRSALSTYDYVQYIHQDNHERD